MSFTFTVPLQVGDKVYTHYLEHGRLKQEEQTVTEVCSKGFFVSRFAPPKDDLGDFIPYDALGKVFFLDANLIMDRAEVTDHE